MARLPGIKTGLVLFFILPAFCCSSQEKAEEVFKPYHRISVGIEHAHISQALRSKSEEAWMVLGAWGIDYHYVFTKKLGLGVQTDIVVDDFEVKAHFDNEPEKVIRRDHPFALCASLAYKANKNLNLLFGTGSEYAPEETLFTTNFGVEYGFELPDDLEFGLGLTYALKWKAYDTWYLGFMISKDIRSK
jgi:hypothetical protein